MAETVVTSGPYKLASDNDNTTTKDASENNNIIKFTFDKEEVEMVNIKSFPVKDREELMKILEWFQSIHKENNLTLSELRSFNKLITIRYKRVFGEIEKIEKQKFFRILFEDKEPEWASVNVSTLKKVPFLEAFSSERWNQKDGDENSLATITSVRASSLNHLDRILNAFENDKLPNSLKFKEQTLLKFFQWLEIYDCAVNQREIYEDFKFLGVFTNDCKDLCIDLTEKFDIASACSQICNDDKNGATKLLLAIYLERFDDKSIDPKTRNLIYKALLFIASNNSDVTDTFKEDFMFYFSKRFKLTQKELAQLNEAKSDAARRRHAMRFDGYHDIHHDEDGFLTKRVRYY